MLVVFAEFELNIKRERQLEGIAAAKKTGKYKGRKPISDDVKLDIHRLPKQNQPSAAIARELNASRNTVYKTINTDN